MQDQLKKFVGFLIGHVNWQRGFKTSHVALGSLTKPWWKSTSYGIMWCSRLGLMVGKNLFDEQ